MAKAAGIECSLAGRQGQRTDLQHPQLIAEVKGESRDIAAKAVDLNRETYRQLKTVSVPGTYLNSLPSNRPVAFPVTLRPIRLPTVPF